VTTAPRNGGAKVKWNPTATNGSTKEVRALTDCQTGENRAGLIVKAASVRADQHLQRDLLLSQGRAWPMS
jgi:hypothetical protein